MYRLGGIEGPKNRLSSCKGVMAGFDARGCSKVYCFMASPYTACTMLSFGGDAVETVHGQRIGLPQKKPRHKPCRCFARSSVLFVATPLPLSGFWWSVQGSRERSRSSSRILPDEAVKRHDVRVSVSNGMPDAGCWMLVAGCWLLVAGC